MHGNICDTHQLDNVDELKQRLTKVWRGLGQSVIDDAVDAWHKRDVSGRVMFVCLFVCLFVYLFVCLFVYLFVWDKVSSMTQ